MDDHPGLAWMSSGENKNYFVKLSTDGVCSISAPYADGNAVRQLFEKLSRSKLLSTENVGSETQIIFAVTHPGWRGAEDGHAIVMVQAWARGNSRPYRESRPYTVKMTRMTHIGSRP
jgi:hypothetical protein